MIKRIGSILLISLFMLTSICFAEKVRIGKVSYLNTTAQSDTGWTKSSTWVNTTNSTDNVSIGSGRLNTTGNITAAYFFGNGSQLTGTGNLSATTLANDQVLVGLSATTARGYSVLIYNNTTGNFTAPYFIGNGSQLTGLNASNLSAGTVAVARGGTGAANFDNLIALTTNTTGNYVASVATTSPLTGGAAGSEGAALPIAINQSSATVDGYLSAINWTTFNGKQDALTNSAGLAGALNDETGTGLAVFSISPAFGTTIALNDTTDANLTMGLILNQLGNDDFIISLKSSDIAHGVTDIAEADTYGAIRKQNNNVGGIEVIGITDAGTQSAAALTGILGATDPTDTVAAIRLRGEKLNATTNVADLGDNETVLKVQNRVTDLLIIKGSGNTTFTGSVNASSFEGSGAGLSLKNITKSFVVYNITNTSDFFIPPISSQATTITKISAYCDGGLNVTGVLLECNTTARDCVVTDTTAWVVENATAFSDTSLTNPTIAAGAWLKWNTNVTNGAPTFFSLGLEYDED